MDFVDMSLQSVLARESFAARVADVLLLLEMHGTRVPLQDASLREILETELTLPRPESVNVLHVLFLFVSHQIMLVRKRLVAKFTIDRLQIDVDVIKVHPEQ